MEEANSSSSWSREEEKAFENALATYPEDSIDRWEKIAESVPGKSVEEIRHHYELLVEDVDGIESGRVPLPNYSSSSEGSGDHSNESGRNSKKVGTHSGDSSHGGKGSKSDQERKKGIAWTEDEHRLFLLGLDKYGKGDWRSISRNFVITRTPTQVASHAQKYFIRLNSMNRDRRRSSIHDITSVGNGDVSTPPGPITGQTNGTTMVSAKPSSKLSSHPLMVPTGVGIYGTTIGQPVGRPLVSAVGTPILPVPGAPQMAYGIRPAVAGPVVPGAPMNITPMTYPIPRTSVPR